MAHERKETDLGSFLYKNPESQERPEQILLRHGERLQMIHHAFDTASIHHRYRPKFPPEEDCPLGQAGLLDRPYHVDHHQSAWETADLVLNGYLHSWDKPHFVSRRWALKGKWYHNQRSA
jgi:hypothetical protein